jgi:hypothetical protein
MTVLLPNIFERYKLSLLFLPYTLVCLPSRLCYLQCENPGLE